MIYFDFKDYEGFKERFGFVEHGNGAKSRRNKILLALYKEKFALKRHIRCVEYQGILVRKDYLKERYNKALVKDPRNAKRMRIEYGKLADRTPSYMPHDLLQPSLPVLKQILLSELRGRSLCVKEDYHVMRLMGQNFYSPDYETDSLEGLCEDGTINAIRYRNIEKEKVFKMKAGKMAKHLIESNRTTCLLPEQIKRWLEEEFSADWTEYARENIVESVYTLHVDEDFEKIYDEDSCAGYDEDGDSFGSCMTNRDNWRFYRDAVDAKAAYLTDCDDMVVARCIIYTDVYDEYGNKWRLAERQYSKFRELNLQRQLISALIRDGHIDGYKRVGASCHSPREFLDNNGNSLEDKSFMIRCRLERGDSVSYQDSFKWFDEREQEAYNYERGDQCLDTTEGEYLSNRVYSEYHDDYFHEDEVTYVETRESYICNDDVVFAYVYSPRSGSFYEEDCLIDDCIQIGSRYYYAGEDAQYPEENGILRCPECGAYIPTDDTWYSELTEQDYCCETCRDDAENEYADEYGYTYCEHECKWLSEDEGTHVSAWGGSGYYDTFVSNEYLDCCFREGCAAFYNDRWYIGGLDEDLMPSVERSAA
jgi:hypothetical protein